MSRKPTPKMSVALFMRENHFSRGLIWRSEDYAPHQPLILYVTGCLAHTDFSMLGRRGSGGKATALGKAFAVGSIERRSKHRHDQLQPPSALRIHGARRHKTPSAAPGQWLTYRRLSGGKISWELSGRFGKVQSFPVAKILLNQAVVNA